MLFEACCKYANGWTLDWSPCLACVLSVTYHSNFVYSVKGPMLSLSAQVRLIDAGFLWTEPHSKRIKIKVTIQKEVRKTANTITVGE